MQIGSYQIPNRLFLAPMAGVTDRPFRQVCRGLGAGYTVGEMVTSRPELQSSRKTVLRADRTGEPEPVAVQIVGTDPAMMAQAARDSVARGAQIIDINMGCPAKKVCSKWAGSALMQDEALALRIVQAVVAVCTPRHALVTLKMRTGWSAAHRNAEALARRFADAGVQMLSIHGRTREQGYKGAAEYETIAAVKQAVRIPVVANGDIGSPEKAKVVQDVTGADALMIGRAAQGRPWLFREIAHYLATGGYLAPPLVVEAQGLVAHHLQEHYALYGEWMGVRSARKHIAWYVRALPGGEAFRAYVNRLESTAAQWRAVQDFFDALGQRMERLPIQPKAVVQGLLSQEVSATI